MNLYAVKTDAAGLVVWSKQYGEDSAVDMGFQAVEVADGYVIAGTTFSYGPGYDAMWLLKLDATGEQVWSRTFGGDSNDWGHALARTADGGFVVAGGAGSFGNSYQMYLVKTDAEGLAQWERTYGDHGYERAEQVVVLADGYLLVGQTQSIATSGNDNLYVVKTDLAGNQLWDYAHGSTGNEFAYAALALPGGDLLIAGGTSGMWDAGGSPGWLLRLDAGGALRWSSRIGDGALANRLGSLIAAGPDAVVVGGYLTETAGADPRACLLKVDLP